MAEKLLVIGGGLLGCEVARLARDDFDTYLTYNTNPSEVEGCSSYRLNITRNLDLIGSLNPDYVVHTAAMTNVDLCEVDRAGAWKVNAAGTRDVAMASKIIGAKLIYISTDYVFDGKNGLYVEAGEPSPINYYGVTKLAGEAFVREICKDYVIARTSVVYGWKSTRLNFVTWVLEELKKRNKIDIVTDQYNSPTFSTSLAEMTLSILEETGIFHASGSKRVSRYDFVMEIAKVFGLDDDLILPITSDRLDWKAIRPKDTSLNISKISGFAKPLNVEDGLVAMRDDN